MIHQLYIFHKSGLVLTSVEFSVKRFKLRPELVGGFLSAIQMFGRELLSDEVATIETGIYQFIWDYMDPVMCVALADRTDDPIALLAVLKTLNVLFAEQYSRQLTNWRGEVGPFREFKSVVRKVISRYLPSFLTPSVPPSPRPDVLSLWRRFGEGLDTLLWALIVGLPLMVVGPKRSNKVIIKRLRTLQQRRLPVMWFDDAASALQVIRDKPAHLPLILSLPPRAYRSTFADAEKRGMAHAAIFAKKNQVEAIGFTPRHLGIAEILERAAERLREDELKRLGETALRTLRDRIIEVARLLTATSNLSDEEAASILRLSVSDYRLAKELAREGGYLHSRRREVKRNERTTWRRKRD